MARGAAALVSALGLGACMSALAQPHAPLCSKFPTFLWGGHAGHFAGQNQYETQG
jgi:hypothetical protein